MSHLVVALGLLLLGGCAGTGLRSASDAAAGDAAATTAADIQVAVGTRAWRGWPSALSRFVTPVHVSLVNRSLAPVRLRHDDFALVRAEGRRLAAVLPQEVRGVVYDRPPAALPSAGFSLGGEADPVEPDWVLGGPTWGASADPVGRVGEQFMLPSPDVLNHALREGVLEPSQTASGFLYFERGPAHADRVEFTARLVDARTGATLGRAVIPVTLP
jgi:hypothetical protein